MDAAQYLCIFGVTGIKYWKAYIKVLTFWKNNLQKMNDLWDMVITLQMEAAQYLWTLLTDQHQYTRGQKKVDTS